VTRRGRALNLLVGPMRPLVAGGAYDPPFHSYEVLSAAGLGVSYDGPGPPTLAPMVYEGAPTKGAVNGRSQ
jgi:hypothetical protein